MKELGYENAVLWKRAGDLSELNLEIRSEEMATMPVWLPGVQCIGTEKSLKFCHYGGCTGKEREFLSYGIFQKRWRIR
jgi:hypothetical protein